jgi:hypothetical protein
MALKNEISKIKMMINEINQLKLRRVYPELRNMVNFFLEHSHPCDFNNAEYFFYGIKDEIFDDGFWLEYDLDWEDIEFALTEYFREMIEDYHNYECQSKMNGEIMEYPNFVYESEDNVNDGEKYYVSDERLEKTIDSLGNREYFSFDDLIKDVVKKLVSQLEGVSMEDRDRIGKMYLSDYRLRLRIEDYYSGNVTGIIAVIEIMKPLAYMNLDYYYQIVQYKDTKAKTIDVRKNVIGDHKRISTKNIKVLKVFYRHETKKAEEYLRRLRNIRNETSW